MQDNLAEAKSIVAELDPDGSEIERNDMAVLYSAIRGLETAFNDVEGDESRRTINVAVEAIISDMNLILREAVMNRQIRSAA